MTSIKTLFMAEGCFPRVPLNKCQGLVRISEYPLDQALLPQKAALFFREGINPGSDARVVEIEVKELDFCALFLWVCGVQGKAHIRSQGAESRYRTECFQE